jgi:hypothetical protein
MVLEAGVVATHISNSFEEGKDGLAKGSYRERMGGLAKGSNRERMGGLAKGSVG